MSIRFHSNSLGVKPVDGAGGFVRRFRRRRLGLRQYATHWDAKLPFTPHRPSRYDESNEPWRHADPDLSLHARMPD
jgi:hypothetical protein